MRNRKVKTERRVASDTLRDNYVRVYLTDAEFEQIDRVARIEDMNRSKLVRRIITFFLNTHRKPNL